MPLRKLKVVGIGLTLLLGACATSQPVMQRTPAAGSGVLAAPAVKMSNGPGPDDETFSIGPAATDTIGGYIPDNQTVTPFDVKNPVVAWLDPPLLAAIQNAARSAASNGVDLEITSGWRTKGFQQRLFDAYAAEVKRVSGSDDGIITAAQGDIDTPTDGFADNSRLYLPPTAFNRFAVTREINDGLLAPRFAPSQRAWVLSGVRVPVSPEVDASTGRDADDR